MWNYKQAASKQAATTKHGKSKIAEAKLFPYKQQNQQMGHVLM